MINEKYNRLKVINFVGVNKHQQKMYLCECECGKETIVNGSALKSGHTKSCGCLVKEVSRRQISKISKVTHGLSKTRFYRIWGTMKTRCFDKNYKSYQYYGGANISVDHKWMSFENFMKDMYSSYMEHASMYGEDKTSIDRIDNSKGYSKDNCRWLTPKGQANNRRDVPFYEYNGEMLTVSQLAEKYNIKYVTLVYRIRIAKWPIKKAIETPIR